MFQFSGFAHLSVYYVFNIVGCPIRISTDQIVCADPRSFSQLITSFFASESLGIPRAPLFTYFYSSVPILIGTSVTISAQHVNELDLLLSRRNEAIEIACGISGE